MSTQLTLEEQERALEALRRWPPYTRSWVMHLPPEELDVVALLAGELGALPSEPDEWALKGGRE